MPSIPLWDKNKFKRESSKDMGSFCKDNFSYNSSTNRHFLTVNEIKILIDKNFNDYP